MRHGFQFHAFATGVSGHITAPFCETITAQAPSALSPNGGYSSGRVVNYRYKEILSFRAAYTQVSGGYSDDTKSWDTIMTSTVEGLEILGGFKAELIVARLASRHDLEQDHEPRIIPIGSRIEGLQIAGHDVNVELHTDLYSHLGTFSSVVEAYRTDPDFRRTFNRANGMGGDVEMPETHRRFFPWSVHEPKTELPQFRGVVTTSLVKELKHRSDYLSTFGNVIYVPQFGTVSIGHFQMDGQARRITMVNVELGCATCGYIDGGSGETNGNPDPPPPHDKTK